MRLPKMTPRLLENGRWELTVPAGLSSTGKRQRLYFTDEKLANTEVKRLKAVRANYGMKARILSERLAEDAVRAEQKLAPHGVTLTAAADFYVRHLNALASSVTFDELWDRNEKRVDGLSVRYKADAARIGGKLSRELGSRVVAAITTNELEKVMEGIWSSPAVFNIALATIKPAFAMAVKKGWSANNPCDGIDKRITGRREIVILTLEQARGLLDACRDHRLPSKQINTGRRGKAALRGLDSESGQDALPDWLQVDASDARVAVAMLLFAGLRPDELTRLDWSNVQFDYGQYGIIKIPGKKSKTGQPRFVPIEKNLRAWIDQIPAKDRVGSIIPDGWRRKWQCVRKVAGIGDLNDVCRHSYASYWLAAFDDVNTLRARMGHQTRDVLFKHYHAVMTKQQGVRYWQIVPSGTPVPKKVYPANA